MTSGHFHLFLALACQRLAISLWCSLPRSSDLGNLIEIFNILPEHCNTPQMPFGMVALAVHAFLHQRLRNRNWVPCSSVSDGLLACYASLWYTLQGLLGTAIIHHCSITPLMSTQSSGTLV